MKNTWNLLTIVAKPTEIQTLDILLFFFPEVDFLFYYNPPNSPQCLYVSFLNIDPSGVWQRRDLKVTRLSNYRTPLLCVWGQLCSVGKLLYELKRVENGWIQPLLGRQLFIGLQGRWERFLRMTHFTTSQRFSFPSSPHLFFSTANLSSSSQSITPAAVAHVSTTIYLIRFLTPLATLFLYRQYRHTGRDFQSRSDKRAQTLNRTEWLTADRPTAYRCSYTPTYLRETYGLCTPMYNISCIVEEHNPMSNRSCHISRIFSG